MLMMPIQANDPWTMRRGKNIERENEPRAAYSRDFARIVHCAAFRRLQGKTQVLGLGDSDFYRTRLTHSMEVAQVCAAIADWFRQRNASKVYPPIAAVPYTQHQIRSLFDAQLSSAIGLAHDLGHPPYGHGGEAALNYCMRDKGGFEGNGQTLRILARLEKYVRDHGLNPTRRLLLGVLKYPVSYGTACNRLGLDYPQPPSIPWLIKKDDYKPPKCYLDTEQDVVEWILDPLSEEDKRRFIDPPYEEGKLSYYHSLDASIMEIADDICYSVHDLEDAISLKFITRENFWPTLEKIGGTNTFLKEIDSDLQKEFPGCDSISKTLQDLFSADPCTRKASIGRLIHLCIIHCRLHYDPNFFSPLLALTAHLEEPFVQLRKYLGKIVTTLVIKSPSVQQLEFKGQRIVIELFSALSMDPERFLPETTKKIYLNSDATLRDRIICDYVAGMTDEYAAKLYERMFFPHRGSVFERL